MIELPDLIDWTVTEDQEKYVQNHRIRLLRTLEQLPDGGGEKSLLDMGSFLQMAPVCKYQLNYAHVAACYLGNKSTRNASVFSRSGKEFVCPMSYFDGERDNFPYKDASFDTVLCCEVLPHAQKDPMWMMFEINRITKLGGVLALTVPNANSIKAAWKVLNGFHPGFFSSYIITGEPRLAREYSPGELNDLMPVSGFHPVSLTGCNYAVDFTSTDLELMEHLKVNNFPDVIRDECLIMVARKIGEPQARYPKWLYY
jgi:SAM-dependent methyltransferase